ncbi:protein CHUP1, chloroplastic-like [Durio zibethinus]|uniref:Protein CHUP1, chloroplastic-like n=1 Tax=Durio zibethinus TaxID=66656 RepID=A0A6P5WW84_DURZI|nr:protein CHUP1, chloroplastic-like [Durio zibethinus]
MVAGKVRLAMGLQKSPANIKHETPPKPPLPSPSSANKNNNSPKPLFSRSFGVYFPRSSAQVQPRPPDVAELLRLVEELRERECRLKTELLEHKLLKESVAIVPVLENEIVVKNAELERALKEVESLRNENETLKTEVEEMKGKIEEEKEGSEKKVRELEEEIAELKKTMSSYSDRNSKAEITAESDELLSSSQRFQGLVEVSVKSNLIKNMKRNNSKCTDAVVFSEKVESLEFKREELETERPRHSRCNSEELVESTLVNIRSRVPRVPKPPPRPSSSWSATSLTSSNSSSDSTEKHIPPPPPPPPPPPSAPVKAVKLVAPYPPPPPRVLKVIAPPPPPPPPPPPKGIIAVAAKVRRVPEVAEFYHSLMRRDSKRETGSCSVPEALPATANPRDMIGEIENRSAHLLAIKTDVETQGDFIRFLIKEVENAAFTDIEDVVPFVKWLDDELSYLVDERAVLKHFSWPEQKADALREVAFGFCDLKKLESEASLFRDDARQPCSPALKKMQALLEKLEHGVYNLSRMRESAAKRYKGFQIPMDWMLETGIVSQIKLVSVKLAMKYMRRVSAELEAVGGGPEEEELIVQGVRFAFRVHQFAGGFDVETMRAFQELRDKARSCHVQCQNQQQKFICRSTTC